MSELIQAGQHPDADQLNAFVEHVLPPHEQQQTLAHLAGCPSCREVVALSLPPEDERQTEVVRRPWFSRWSLAWAGIPALAAVILVVFFVSSSKRIGRQISAPGQMAEAHSPAPPPAEATPPEPMPPAAPLRQRLEENRAVASAKKSSPVGQGEPAAGGGSGGGVMGGVLGGIGGPAPQPSAQAHSFAPASGSFRGPPTSLAVDQLQSGLSSFPRVNPLPSRLAIVSMASRASKRLAIDTQHHLFCSDDEGRSWKAVASPWKGRAVAVALFIPHVPPPLFVMSSHAAANTGAAFGSIAGAIKDPSGAVIPGATVVATHSGGTPVRGATTDSQGRFRIEDLVPGSYQVEAQAPGFLKQSFASEVAPSQQAVADVALQLSSVAQSVMIQAAPSPAENAVAATKAAPSQTLSPFVLTTDDGEHWTSTDGRSWVRQ